MAISLNVKETFFTSGSAVRPFEPAEAKMLGSPRKTFVYSSFKTGTLSLPGTKKPVKGEYMPSSWILTILVLNERS
ncbi:MAG: hypothetical protein ABSD38_26050 [Syntrophorhabdales bacterium]|jgi:hypothetical protein